jgi:hypothetical protein
MGWCECLIGLAILAPVVAVARQRLFPGRAPRPEVAEPVE